MYMGSGPLRQLRSMARAALPPRALLKIDRGDALFVTNAPAFAPEMRDIPGFMCERRGALLCLLPEASWVLRWERRQGEPEDELCRSLLRFKGQLPDRANLALFAQGAKLLDGHPIPEALAAFDRALRRRAAVALRGGCGGALFACAVLRFLTEKKESGG